MNTPTIWVLNRRNRLNTYQSQRLHEEAENLGITLKHVVAEDFEILEPLTDTNVISYQGEYVMLPDAILTRQTGMTYFAHALLRHLDRRGVLVANTSEAIDNAEDKLKTIQLLSAYELPIPKSVLAKFPLNTDYIEHEIGFPLVMKTVLGTKGQGVLLFETKEQFEDKVGVLQRLTAGKEQLIVQEFIEASKGTDLRVYVVGGETIGCVQRTAADPETQFKANVALGGTAEYREVDEDMAEIAVQSAKAVGLDIAGVDLLLDDDGYKVCEVNSSPSFEGFEVDADVNVPRAMLEFFLRELRP